MEACRRLWVRTEALDTVVLVTTEDVPKDRLTGPVTTACLPLGMAVVPLVAASTDTDTDTPPTDSDPDMGTTLEAFTAREGEREASVSTAEELVGLDSMVLVATEEGWAGLEALPMTRPMLTVDLHLVAVSPGPCRILLAVPSTEPVTTPSTLGKSARKRDCWHLWARTGALDTAALATTK